MITFQLPTNKLSICVPSTTEMSTCIWPCALHLTAVLFSYPPEFFKERVVVELGAGLALPSLSLLITFKPNSVIITEREEDPSALLNVRDSLSLNQIVNNNVIVSPLDWQNATCFSLDKLKNHENCRLSEDLLLILASDCLYDKNDFESLVYAISVLLRKSCNPNGFALLSYQLRNSRYSIQRWLDLYGLEAIRINRDSYRQTLNCLISLNKEISPQHEIESIEIFKVKIKEAKS